MATTRYFSSFNSENSIYLEWICVGLRLVEDTHHRWPRERQWRHVRIAFYSAIIPIPSSQIIRYQAKETNAGVALTTRRFVLNIYVVQTKFICTVDPISVREMVPTISIKFMTVNIVKLFTRTLAYAYFIIHRIRQTIFFPVYDF